MQEDKKFSHRVLNVSGNLLFLARGQVVFQKEGIDSTAYKIGSMPASRWQSVLSRFALAARLFRLGIHHLVNAGCSQLAVANRATFCLDQDEIREIGPLRGSRPLVLGQSGDYVFYGEYRSNPERSPVHIWEWRKGTNDWRVAWTFNNIRHVHGVFNDPYTGHIWVTTGDHDDEVGIWCTKDQFQTLSRVAGGSQQFRAVQLLFSQDFVYFGSDAPDEANHLYRMRRSGEGLEWLASVGSSVFYGCKVGDSLFFSTAVEPSSVNMTDFAEVWRSDDGVNWHRFLRFKRDWWPMKYFQYGQVHFPAGPGDDEHLYVIPFATEEHGKTLVYRIKSFDNN